jgi:hypothetical protein
VILQHGIAAIPAAIFHYQGEIGLKAQHVWFIAYILSHKWDEDLPYPSLSNMARCSGTTLRNIQFITKPTFAERACSRSPSATPAREGGTRTPTISQAYPPI